MANFLEEPKVHIYLCVFSFDYHSSGKQHKFSNSLVDFYCMIGIVEKLFAEESGIILEVEQNVVMLKNLVISKMFFVLMKYLLKISDSLLRSPVQKQW